MRILLIENYDRCCFCNHDSTHFSILRVSANALCDCYSRIVDSFIFIRWWSQLLFPVKGYCVYMINKIIHGCLEIWNSSSRRRAHVFVSIMKCTSLFSQFQPIKSCRSKLRCRKVYFRFMKHDTVQVMSSELNSKESIIFRKTNFQYDLGSGAKLKMSFCYRWRSSKIRRFISCGNQDE